MILERTILRVVITLSVNIKKLSMIAQQIEKIINTCLKYQIENYTINPDGSIDVDGHVDISSRDLTLLPLRFGRVMGNFNVQNNRLTTLYGAPMVVGGNFNCYHNRLTNLIGSPEWVGGDFFCYQNQLLSLEASPKVVVGSYYISGNNKLSNLVGCTVIIGGNFSFDDSLLSSFSGEDDIEFEGDFYLNETHYDKLNNGKFPFEIINNQQYLKLILKYQRYFQIWNEDLSLNIENFNDLLADIDEGLQ